MKQRNVDLKYTNKFQKEPTTKAKAYVDEDVTRYMEYITKHHALDISGLYDVWSCIPERPPKPPKKVKPKKSVVKDAKKPKDRLGWDF